jgi:hypothetical protein
MLLWNLHKADILGIVDKNRLWYPLAIEVRRDIRPFLLQLGEDLGIDAGLEQLVCKRMAFSQSLSVADILGKATNFGVVSDLNWLYQLEFFQTRETGIGLGVREIVKEVQPLLRVVA